MAMAKKCISLYRDSSGLGGVVTLLHCCFYLYGSLALSLLVQWHIVSVGVTIEDGDMVIGSHILVEIGVCRRKKKC